PRILPRKGGTSNLSALYALVSMAAVHHPVTVITITVGFIIESFTVLTPSDSAWRGAVHDVWKHPGVVIGIRHQRSRAPRSRRVHLSVQISTGSRSHIGP